MMKLTTRLASLSVVALLASAPLAAQTAKPAAAASNASAPAAPAPASTPTPAPAPAGSSIQTPMDDLGLRKEAIPPVLLKAVEYPYSMQGMTQCPQIASEVEALNVALGPDIDLPQPSGSRLAAGDLVNFAASSVIPFRGLIREVTGASSRQRQMQEAVLAGFARRAFLKGLGEARGCAYPAKPATLAIIEAQAAALMASLEQLCGPLPNGQKRTKKEEWLNSRKCADYKRAKADAEAIAAARATPAATAPAAPAATPPARSN